MTDDYKETLLKYITNNLDEETGVNIPSFNQVQTESATAIRNQLIQSFPYGYRQNGIMQCKNATGQYNGYIIVYGMYFTEEHRQPQYAYGYMLLFNENMELVQVIKNYKSGTDCGIFMKIIAIDDGTLVALDHYDNRNRIVLLNNPSVKLPSSQNYELVMRTSYNLQGDCANMTYTMVGKEYVLEKDPNSANYLIGANDNYLAYEAMTQFTINVGSTNTWTDYTFTHANVPGSEYTFDNILYTYVHWENTIPYINTYDLANGYIESSDDWTVKLYIYTNNGTTNINQLVSDNIFTKTHMDEFTDAAIQLISPTNFYFLFNYGDIIYSDDSTDCYLYIYHVVNGQIVATPYSDIFNQPSETGIWGNYSIIRFYNLEGTICAIYTTITERLEDYNPMKTVAVLITNDDKSTSIEIGAPYSWSYAEFHMDVIIKQYDLYKFFTAFEDIEEGWVINKSDIIYNYLQYNGSPYENVNSLKAKQGILYDSNGLAFARGIYNHVVNENITEDTIQIPNTMLNDTQLIKNQLIGQTNKIMVEDNDTIEKNIYETLYINYFNTLNIINRNNYPLIQVNRPGAIRLNNSISNTNDYDNAKITKIRINYTDNTNVVKEIDPPSISDGEATYTFTVTTGKPIRTIEMISDDETTTYQTIEAQVLAVHKLYIITQKCHIE